ncbi:prolipoprotein diacylglyceryl transferase [Bradyrhizobium sp.]|jgi:phosphatidylglycerol:prolipoprotein diacylglycerol transferase|uniref:prolipoprotein diacylglyceryl transferase n=1 Tax=Bradyrhizobium sp. TaxID=376 RepID=UPI002E07BAFC|nr:prolipoprotein diacylglyceryl transferase family protein [Bradyrhizobium sp.]
MRRILISWRGLNIYSYPAMLYVGLLAGVFAGAYVAQSAGLSADRFAIAVTILMIPALAGSRLYFVLTRWDIYRHDPARIWRRDEGGMSMYGGFILAVPLSIPLLRSLGLPFGGFWDAAVLTILLGMAFTRIGCFLNGCCGGRPSDAWFALILPDHHGIWQRRIPTQLMEMAFAMMLFGAALALRNVAPFPGAIFCLVLAGYGLGRWYLESLREDETGGRDRTAMQATSVLLVIAALAGLAFVWG